MVTSYKPLHLHPVLPSSRRLVKSFEDEIKVLVSNGTVSRPESIKEGADRIAGTIVRDGRVSDTELKTLKRIKEKLNPDAKADPDVMAERQAASNLYGALEVDYENKSIAAKSPNMLATDLPVHPLLPSSRKMLEALQQSAGRLGMHSDFEIPALIEGEAKKVIAAFAGDDQPSGHQGWFANEVATAAQNILTYLKRDPYDPIAFDKNKYTALVMLAEYVARAAQ